MTTVVGVRFKNNGRIYYFDPGALDIHEGDGAIVETARGIEFGDVVQGNTEVPDEQVVQPLRVVLRIATETDRAMREANAAREGEAFEVCQKKIEQHKLDMKLVNVEYTFNGSKVIFYFTADERVDFRELVKDLAGHFKTRIELRQIGVRDEAKMLGGLGSCGRPVCCKTFLDDFRPVSIKMAKEQNLSLSPTKISGLCGRLMCCLQYEQAAYEEMKKLMPKTGKEIQTPDGNGIAVENNAITEKTKVKLMLPDGTFDLRWYHYSELAKVGDPAPKAREKAAPEPAAPAQAEYVQPDLPPQAEVKKPSRRRRGGRGGAASSAPADKPAAEKESRPQQADKAAGSEAPRQPRRRRRKPAGDGSGAPASAQQQPKEPKQPQQPKQAQQQPKAGEQGDSANTAPRRPRRRRRKPAGDGKGAPANGPAGE